MTVVTKLVPLEEFAHVLLLPLNRHLNDTSPIFNFKNGQVITIIVLNLNF